MEQLGIADLIPIGRENAIKRSCLVNECIKHNLVKSADADREMRRLIQKARIDYVILNLSNGEGYYRPSFEDIQDLQRYIRQEKSRAIQSFSNVKRARALYEDYKRGRIG